MATITPVNEHECFKCDGKPGFVPLSCNKHYVCRDCMVARVQANPANDEEKTAELAFKCPVDDCQVNTAPSMSNVALPTVTVALSNQCVSDSRDRSYKEVLVSKPPVGSTGTTQSPSASLVVESEDGHLPRVWIFVHQSNMWIEAKKLYSRQKGFVTDQDHRVRIDMGKLADVLGGGREEVKGKLYGSEPPPIDSVWERIREKGWEVITSQRSPLTGKEKQVDTKLVTDVISLACKTPVHERTTIIIVSGDAEILPAIEGVLGEEQWKVEVYMWANSISNQLRKFARSKCYSDRIKVIDLDQYLEKVTFTNMKFNISNPKVRSMVCAYGIVFTMNEGAFSPRQVPTADWIDSLESLAHWPIQYYWFRHRTSSTKNPDLVVVFRPVSGKRFDIANFVEIVKNPIERETMYRLPLIQNVQTFIQFISALAKEERQDPAIKQFDAALEQVGIYTHDDVCAGYENEADEFERWRIFQKKHRPQSRRRYTLECPKRFNCYNGTRCYYGHSEEELAYFKKRKEGRGNPNRKVTLCKNFQNKRCQKKKEECDWAHGEEDAWCKECRKTGHLTSKCPQRTPTPTWSSII